MSRYDLDDRSHIDNNGVENAIRPLAVGHKNYLFCGNHDAAAARHMTSMFAHGLAINGYYLPVADNFLHVL